MKLIKPVDGALDATDCPSFRCKCGKCAICGYQKHMAIHCGVIGNPQKPYGHVFIAETNKPKLYKNIS